MDYLRTHHLGDYYVIIMEELGDQVCQVLRVLLNSQGITLFHCAHGKDRTGVIALVSIFLQKHHVKTSSITIRCLSIISDTFLTRLWRGLPMI